MTEAQKSKKVSQSGNKAYSAPAAEKMLDILEYMASVTSPQKQNEIAAGVGRTLNEVYRIILLLEQRGYLVRDARSDLYGLTLKLFQLAHTTDQVRGLSEASLDPMRNLTQQIRQSCHLAVLNGIEVTIINQINSPLGMKYSVALGQSFLAQQTSSGLVLLAGLPPQRREKALTELEKQLEQGESIQSLNSILNDVINQGYDIRPSFVVAGVTNITFPIYDVHRETVAALTVPFLPIKGMTGTIDDAIQAARDTASTISYELGYRNDSADF